MTQQRYTVETRNGWSYVVGPVETGDAGPWRYRWEAQELADELNAATRGEDKPR